MEPIELDKEEWMKAFRSLPKERQVMLETWFSTQALIIQHAGIPEQEWFGLVGWALENPGDFSFIDGFAANAGEGDARESGTAVDDARKIVGGATAKNVATGPGLKEKATKEGLDRDLYKQFMANKMNASPQRAKKKPAPPPVQPSTPTKDAAKEPKVDPRASPRGPARPKR